MRVKCKKLRDVDLGKIEGYLDWNAVIVYIEECEDNIINVREGDIVYYYYYTHDNKILIPKDLCEIIYDKSEKIKELEDKINELKDNLNQLNFDLFELKRSQNEII